MTHLKLEYGTLIYIIEELKLAKYLIYKKDEKSHLLQEIPKKDYNFNCFHYMDVEDIVLRTCIINKEEIFDFLKFKISHLESEINLIVEEISYLKNNGPYNKEIDDLWNEIENLRKKEATPNRLKAKKQLLKAIGRYHKKGKRVLSDRLNDKNYELKRVQNDLTRLKEQFSYLKNM